MKVKSECCGKPITFPPDWPEVPSVPSCTKCEKICQVVRDNPIINLIFFLLDSADTISHIGNAIFNSLFFLVFAYLGYELITPIKEIPLITIIYAILIAGCTGVIFVGNIKDW